MHYSRPWNEAYCDKKTPVDEFLCPPLLPSSHLEELLSVVGGFNPANWAMNEKRNPSRRLAGGAGAGSFPFGGSARSAGRERGSPRATVPRAGRYGMEGRAPAAKVVKRREESEGVCVCVMGGVCEG